MWGNMAYAATTRMNMWITHGKQYDLSRVAVRYSLIPIRRLNVGVHHKRSCILQMRHSGIRESATARKSISNQQTALCFQLRNMLMRLMRSSAERESGPITRKT